MSEYGTMSVMEQLQRENASLREEVAYEKARADHNEEVVKERIQEVERLKEENKEAIRCRDYWVERYNECAGRINKTITTLKAENERLKEELESTKDTLHYVNLQPCGGCTQSEHTMNDMSSEIARLTAENIELSGCLDRACKANDGFSQINNGLQAKLSRYEGASCICDCGTYCGEEFDRMKEKLSRYESGVEVKCDN